VRDYSKEESMAPTAGWAFLFLLEVWRPELTAPSFAHLVVLAGGWLRTQGRHAVTQALVESGLSGLSHHEAFHRFFSHARWSADDFGRRVFELILPWATPDGLLRLAVDDTLARKTGKHIEGIGSHLDAVQSRGDKYKVFSFGHCWVVLCVIVQPSFSKRPWALPVLLRLYRSKKSCLRKHRPFQPKTELARQMVELLDCWLERSSAGRRPRVELMLDSAYCCRRVLRGIPPSFVVYGEMKLNSRLWHLPPKHPPKQRRERGRPRSYGRRMAKLKERTRRGRWRRVKVCLGGRQRSIQYQSFIALRKDVTGTNPLMVVCVKCTSGQKSLRVFFCTEGSASVREVLEEYGYRWSEEVTFRDVKQELGLDESSARSRRAVERTAPLIALLFSLLTFWFEHHVQTTPLAEPPVRPWYRHRKAASFADVRRAALLALGSLDIHVIYATLRESGEMAHRPLSAVRSSLSQAA
jgi:hypothetical protein